MQLPATSYGAYASPLPSGLAPVGQAGGYTTATLGPVGSYSSVPSAHHVAQVPSGVDRHYSLDSHPAAATWAAQPVHSNVYQLQPAPAAPVASRGISWPGAGTGLGTGAQFPFHQPPPAQPGVGGGPFIFDANPPWAQESHLAPATAQVTPATTWAPSGGASAASQGLPSRARTEGLLVAYPPSVGPAEGGVSYPQPQADQAPDHASRRAAVCHQTFAFIDASRTGYIDIQQNKTALTIVFQQLGDVPMPKDDWYQLVFRNFDCYDKGLIDFVSFQEIVTQWHEHHLTRRGSTHSRTSSAATTTAPRDSSEDLVLDSEGLPPPPPSAFLQAEGSTAEVLPPPAPREGVLRPAVAACVHQGPAGDLGAGPAGASVSQHKEPDVSFGLPTVPDTPAEHRRPSPEGPGEEPSCSLGHPLVPEVRPGNVCDVCKAVPEMGTNHRCARGCDYDMCAQCFRQKRADLSAQARPAPAAAQPGGGSGPKPAPLSYGSDGDAGPGTPDCASPSCTPTATGSPPSGRASAATIVSEVMFPTFVGRLAIFDDYEFFGDVGHGSFGKVMVVRHRSTKQVRACKVLVVQSALHRELVDNEIGLLKSLNHPNIMKLYEVYFEQENQKERKKALNGNIYLITELCEGGDLFSRILHHYETLKQPMTEGHVAFMMEQILSAMKYCHDRKIIHRDVKPENILFVNRSSSSPLKIIDFGLANFVEKIRETAKEVKVQREGTIGKLARMLPTVGGRHIIPWHVRKQVMQRAGTAHYMAPEMIEGYYDEKVDIFSLGVILYQLFTGEHPFYNPQTDDEASVRAKIASVDPVNFPEALWSNVSPEGRDLCDSLLRKDPALRPSAEEALGAGWFRAKPSAFGNKEGLSMSIFEGLVKYQAYNKLKRAVLQLLTRELSEFQIQELRKKFMALDSDGHGLLSISSLAEGMRHVGYNMSDAELEGVVAALDNTGMRKIGYKEFISALIERRVKFDRQQLWECFKKFDTRNSGKITYEDVRKTLASADDRPSITKSEWHEIALPGKGGMEDSDNIELTFEDFAALMEAEVPDG